MSYNYFTCTFQIIFQVSSVWDLNSVYIANTKLFTEIDNEELSVLVILNSCHIKIVPILISNSHSVIVDGQVSCMNCDVGGFMVTQNLDLNISPDGEIVGDDERHKFLERPFNIIDLLTSAMQYQYEYSSIQFSLKTLHFND